MIIGVEDYVFYSLILVSLFLIIGILAFYLSLKKSVPDAFVHKEAKKKGMPICRVHYRGKRAVDYIATIEKNEKDMATPYWRVPSVGIKFKPGADDIETIEGSIPCTNYFTNLTESQSIATVVAFAQLKEFFGKKLKMPIDTIEDVAMYAAADYIKSGDKQRAIENAKINSVETRNYLMKYLDAIDKNKEFLENMKLESGVFTFQTAMKALDSVIGWTSSHAEELQKTVKAAAINEAQNEKEKYRQMIMMAIAAFIIVIAAVTFIIVIRK